MKVFLGGTCNNSTWRDRLIKMLTIEYFDPVVDDWTPDDMEEEIHQREICDYVLYVITPAMTGVYSIAEVVDDSNKRSAKTLFCILQQDHPASFQSFDEGQWKSLQQVSQMVEENGAKIFGALSQIAEYLNGMK